ncbi:MAG: serine hydrolase domain-containing protein [Rubripirellula sp.]
MSRILLVLVVMVLPNMLSSFSASADDLPVASPEDVGMSASKLAQVDAAMEESIAQNRIAGGVVMVARNGKVVHHRAYGKRDIEADLPMQPDTIVRIYSMTKAITTTAAMMLVEEGKIDVDDPVSKYLPELAKVAVAVDGNVEPAKQTMTIADLMRHTAGYGYGATGNAVSDRVFGQLNVMDRDATLAQLQTKLGELPLVFQPGSDWLYGISIDVLGRVVEVVSQQPLDEFFQQRIFDPLAMEDTGFFVPANKEERFAANYNSDGKGKLTLGDDPKTSRYRDDPAFLSGGGGLVSTAADYMRFLLMIAGGGESSGVRLMKPETVVMMTTNQLPKDVGWIKFGKEVRKGVGFGFGFNVRDEMSDWDPSGRVGEYGWGGAASTHYWVSPKDDLIVITLEQVMPYQWLTELKVKGIIYDAIEN